MTEAGLREPLQPGLIDRLLDDERFITLIQVCVDRAEFARLGLREAEFLAVFAARNLRPEARPAAGGLSPLETEREYWFATAGRTAVLQQLKEYSLRAAGAGNGAILQSFCRFHAEAVRNAQTSTVGRNQFNMRRLREAVFRDLRWLLNSTSLDSVTDLSPYGEVARSVLNYGMPTLAGRPMSSIDVGATAERIATAIKAFEPRLGKVYVTPQTPGEGGQEFAMEFQIEAELWGQPVPQRLLMRTRIDLDSGQVSLAEAGTA
jgi:type VI secretion system protein ImpF